MCAHRLAGGRSWIRAPHLGTSFLLFTLTRRAGSESQADTHMLQPLWAGMQLSQGSKIHAEGALCPAESLPHCSLHSPGTAHPAHGSWATSPSPDKSPWCPGPTGKAPSCPWGQGSAALSGFPPAQGHAQISPFLNLC